MEGSNMTISVKTGLREFDLIVSKEAARLLKACTLCHIPLNTSDLEMALRYGRKLICWSCARKIVQLYMIKKRRLEMKYGRRRRVKVRKDD